MPVSRLAIGFVTGLAVPPIITAFVLRPLLIQTHFAEINSIQNEMDFVGWHIRHMEEAKGITGDALYTPTSLYQV